MYHVSQFRKQTKKQNGKPYSGFVTFDVNSESQTVALIATDGDLHMEETIALLEVEGTFKFQMHTKDILDTLGSMSEQPLEFSVTPCGNVRIKDIFSKLIYKK